MDANYEKRQIRKQNKGWQERKTPNKKNHVDKAHPWFRTSYLVKSRIDKLANFDINNNDIKRD